MASEQTRPFKKQSRKQTKEEHPQVLYRHEECIPSSKLLQSCDKHNLLGLKNNQNIASCTTLSNDQDAYDLKNKSKESNLKIKNKVKLEKNQSQTTSNPLKNTTSSEVEEFSKSRKRRLRKRRLLTLLAPTLNNTKPHIPVNNNPGTKSAPLPTTHPNGTLPSSSTPSSNRVNDPVKCSKDLRKRPDKSVGSRNKTIKSKSLVDTTTPSKADIIKTLEEKTLNSLLQTLVPINNYSPKKEKICLPHFYFPEKGLESSDTKVDKDSVFYFGETKHQLEKLTCGFNKYDRNNSLETSGSLQNVELTNNCFKVNNQKNLPNCNSSFNFSPIECENIGNSPVSFVKANQSFHCSETILPPTNVDYTNFLPGSSSSGLQTIDSVCNTSPLNEYYTHHNINLSSVNSNISDFVVKPDLSDNVNPTKKVQLLNSSVEKLDPDSKVCKTNILVEAVTSGNIMDAKDEVKKSNEINKGNKTREEIKLEREAKKAAKLAAKAKHKTTQSSKTDISTASKDISKLESAVVLQGKQDSSLQTRSSGSVTEALPTSQLVNNKISGDKEISSDQLSVDPVKKVSESSGKATDTSTNTKQESCPATKSELKAERRAKQEAQRAAKAAKNQSQPKEKVVIPIKDKPIKTETNAGQVKKKLEVVKSSTQAKPKLFSHLYQKETNFTSNEIQKIKDLHPAIMRLGVQYAGKVVMGSNARCVALLHALKQLVDGYSTPSEKEFSRGLEEELGSVMTYLNQCRPLAVSMTNALRHIKRTLTQLPNTVTDIEARRKICDVIDTYIHEQIDVAGKAICNTVKEKIANGDVILTYGCSSLVYKILVESHQAGRKFRVVVVDGLPWREGREMLRRLVEKGLSCTYILITAASFIMREASKVLLGAHALLANGYVMSRAGSSQVALLAHCYNVPVLVCCETHKFCERVQTDAFVYNELGELCCDNIKDKDKSRIMTSLTPLSLAYDITPPDFVSAVVTELAVLPCTSVPVILRIKPSESVM